MDLKKAIIDRRSIRKYLDKDVKLEDISEILEAGHYAPSSGNIQNWKFIVVKDKKRIEEVADACLDQNWMKMAPVLIVVCNDNQDVNRMYKKKGERYSVQNCAAAIQNILLAAFDRGLGSCWVGAFNGDGIRRILSIPEDIPIEAIITLGYPAEKPGLRDGKQRRRKALEHIVFFESYGSKEIDRRFWSLNKNLQKLKGILRLGKIRK